MIENTVKVNSSFESGTAALLVQTASKYSSGIFLQIGNKKANAKSIMGVISLGIEEGQEVTIKAVGNDENSAVSALEALLSK